MVENKSGLRATNRSIHPFDLIAPGKLRRYFLPSVGLYAALQILFGLLDMPLRTAAAPNGIVSFELAANATAAQSILVSWNEAARLDAAFGLGIDYLFMLAYSTMIGLACIWSERSLRALGWPAGWLGGWLAWGVWAAAAFDAIENAMLIIQLFAGGADTYAAVGALCATVKFLLIALGILYMGYGGAAWLTSRRSVAIRS